MSAMQGYAHPDLLAEPDWLWEQRDNPSVLVIDSASWEKYERAHIPGSVGLPVHPWIKETEGGMHVMGAEPFADLMSTLGVSDDTTVVTYDDFNTSFATRLWWVLNYYGHRNVRVLNGGWKRWVTEGRAVTFQATTPTPGKFTPRPDEAMICRLDDVLAQHQEAGTKILNVLFETWYRGTENPFGNKRVGHIPGSLNIPIERFLTDDDPRVFRPAAELQAVLDQAGLSPKHEVIVHCQAGIRTTVAVFVLALLGWDNVRAYDASMAEWANRDDTPLVTDPG